MRTKENIADNRKLQIYRAEANNYVTRRVP